jgi:hypothetical protein
VFAVRCALDVQDPIDLSRGRLIRSRDDVRTRIRGQVGNLHIALAVYKSPKASTDAVRYGECLCMLAPTLQKPAQLPMSSKPASIVCLKYAWLS